MLQLEKLRFNFFNVINHKSENSNLKFPKQKNNDDENKIDSPKLIPDISDMEFKWMDDHY